MPSALAGVVTASAGFGVVVGMLAGLKISPLVLVLIAVCVLVAITSSPPAALMIAVPLVMNIMLGQGMAPDVVLQHAPAIMRISAIAATTFETLPINGLIILTLNLIGSIVATVLLIAFPGLA